MNKLIEECKLDKVIICERAKNIVGAICINLSRQGR